jgi:hypothetical protein
MTPRANFNVPLSFRKTESSWPLALYKITLHELFIWPIHS